MLMQRSYKPVDIEQSKTQESALQASFFFKQQHSMETQLLCDPYIKSVLKLRYFYSHFYLLRATVYNSAKASTPSSMCLNTKTLFLNSAYKKSAFKSCEVSDALSGRRVRANRPHCVEAILTIFSKRTGGNNFLFRSYQRVSADEETFCLYTRSNRQSL